MRQRTGGGGGHTAGSERHRNGCNDETNCAMRYAGVCCDVTCTFNFADGCCLLDPWHRLLQLTEYCVEHLALWGLPYHQQSKARTRRLKIFPMIRKEGLSSTE